MGGRSRHRTLPGDVRELAILITARSVSQGYEWIVHAKIARKEGLAEDVIERVRTRGDLASLPPRWSASSGSPASWSSSSWPGSIE